MAAGKTYEPIATTTLSSAASSITFSSIPSTYTDLRIVIVPTANAGIPMAMRFNNDAGNNYSKTGLIGDGSSASSSRLTNQTQIATANSGLSTSIPSLFTYDIFSYAGSTYKTVLITDSQDFNGSGNVGRYVGLWRDTSAINSISWQWSSYTFSAGTTLTLYGIKAA